MGIDLIPAAHAAQELSKKISVASLDPENEGFFFDGAFFDTVMKTEKKNIEKNVKSLTIYFMLSNASFFHIGRTASAPRECYGSK